MPIIFRISHGAKASRDHTSDIPSPMVIKDGVDDLWNPLDNGRITSKRAYARQLRQGGYEVNEQATIRDQNGPTYDVTGIAGEVARALRDLKGQ